MNQTNEKVNKYFAVNSVERSIVPSFSDKKRQVSSTVLDKELSEGIYFWDPVLRQFIKFGK